MGEGGREQGESVILTLQLLWSYFKTNDPSAENLCTLKGD